MNAYLTTERWAVPVADRLVVRRRYQDEVALGSGVPSEDEVALCTMTGLSPYMAWYFPRGGADNHRYLTFRGVPEGEVARWKAALTTLLKKLTLKHSRPLVLKSPPHTARIRLLLDLFPDARFVHIHRDPYDVFGSTRHLVRAVQLVFRLQECPPPDGDDTVLGIYNEMYDAFFEERGLIPVGRSCEVGYEDLEREPLTVVGSIYEALGLTGFDELRPGLEGYLTSIVGYRKNRHDGLPDPLRRRIAHEWGRSFDEWATIVDAPAERRHVPYAFLLCLPIGHQVAPFGESGLWKSSTPIQPARFLTALTIAAADSLPNRFWSRRMYR